MTKQDVPGHDRLGVAVVNYYSRDNVGTLLMSLLAFADTTPIHAVVVDNSQDEYGEEFRELCRLASNVSNEHFSIEVVSAPKNLGYGAGNNLAMDRLIQLGSTLLWVLNPDTQIEGAASLMLSEAAASQSDVWSTSTVEHDAMSDGLHTLNTLTGRSGSSRSGTLSVRRFSLDYPGGHSIVFRRRAWLDLKGFDPSYFLFVEEADIAFRCSLLGIPIGTLHSVTVHHDQGLTTGSTANLAAKSLVAFRESTRSRVIFFRKFYPRRLLLLVASRAAYMIVVIFRGNLSGAIAVLNGLRSGFSDPIKGKEL